MARILCPLPDRDFDTTEVAVPWHVLTKAGHEVVFATETGATPACDPRLLTGVIFGQLGAAPDAKACYAELERTSPFRSPLAWDALVPSDYDALLLPGGHAPGMRQYLGSPVLQAKIGAFWVLPSTAPSGRGVPAGAGLGRPVGAICHGVLVLARTIVDGKSVLHAQRTTCLPKYMERSAYFLTAWKLGSYYRTYPDYVEDEVKVALDDESQFVLGPRTLSARGTETDDSAAFVVEDGRYVSARWPGDAWAFARALLARL